MGPRVPHKWFGESFKGVWKMVPAAEILTPCCVNISKMNDCLMPSFLLLRTWADRIPSHRTPETKNSDAHYHESLLGARVIMFDTFILRKCLILLRVALVYVNWLDNFDYGKSKFTRFRRNCQHWIQTNNDRNGISKEEEEWALSAYTSTLDINTD